jgi:hypothetical protein
MVSDYGEERSMQSILEQVISLFGWASVSEALKRKTEVRRYSLKHPLTVSNACKSFVGKLEDEIELTAFINSLDSDLMDCLINNLVGDIGTDILRDMGLEFLED